MLLSEAAEWAGIRLPGSYSLCKIFDRGKRGIIMPRKSPIISVALFLSGLIFISPLSADNGNYRNFLVGDRAAGMGGAVVASTADLDACYYNPAGLGRVSGSRISLSASLYGIYRVRVNEGLGPGESYKTHAFESIPSTFGSILKVSDRLALAISAFTPDQIDYDSQSSFERQPYRTGMLQSDYYATTVDDTLMWIGPSLGWKVTPRFSIGCGAYVAYRTSVRRQSWSYLYTNESDNSIVEVLSRQYSIDYSNYGLLGLFGGQYFLTDEISVGVTVQTPTVNLTGDGEVLYSASLGGSGNDELFHAENMESKNKIPARISGGISYREPGHYGFEVDVSYHFPTSYTELSGDDIWSGDPVTLNVRKEPVTNVNLGAEYYLLENHPLRLGFFTNLSSAPYPDLDSAASGEDVDMYGASASAGYETEHSTFTLGLNYVWGKGKCLGFGQDFQPVVVDVRESYIFVFLASAYIF